MRTLWQVAYSMYQYDTVHGANANDRWSLIMGHSPELQQTDCMSKTLHLRKPINWYTSRYPLKVTRWAKSYI